MHIRPFFKSYSFFFLCIRSCCDIAFVPKTLIRIRPFFQSRIRPFFLPLHKKGTNVIFIKQNPSYDPPKKKGRMHIRPFFKSHSFFFFAFVPFYSFLLLGHCFQAFSWVLGQGQQQKRGAEAGARPERMRRGEAGGWTSR